MTGSEFLGLPVDYIFEDHTKAIAERSGIATEGKVNFSANAFALETGAWGGRQTVRDHREFRYESEKEINALNFILCEQSEWEEILALNRVVPVRVTYDSLIDVPAVCQSVCHQLGGATQYSFSLERARTTKKAAGVNEESIHNVANEAAY